MYLSKQKSKEVRESSLIAEKIIEVRRKINNLLKKCVDDSLNTSKSFYQEFKIVNYK